MKKTLALVLALIMAVGLLAACGGGPASSTPAEPASTTADPVSTAAPESTAPAAEPVELSIVTTYGQEDGNWQNFNDAMQAWIAETGNTVSENSSTSTEEFKAQVTTDFEIGGEPDVLFYFSGADAAPFADKLVPIEEIRQEYPDFAMNMDQAAMPLNPADDKMYAVPTTGFWEGLFYNKTVLAAAGVEAPGPNTTWDEFLEICQAIKDAGFTPIAIGADIPHYWFEFLIVNAGGTAQHMTLPTADNAARDAWIEGISQFQVLYERGFFPDNYLTGTNEEAKALVADGLAGFIGEGSWTVGWFQENANVDDIGVCGIGGTSVHPATGIIAGVSSGYMITRKAWDDPAKRAAAVSFVSWMTTDEVVSKMTATAVASNILVNSAPVSEFANSLAESAFNFTSAATETSNAVQDICAGDARETLFVSDIPQVATGAMTAEAAVDAFIEAFYAA